VDEAQRLLLWQWSTGVQVLSLAMVVAFFYLLARANPRPELRWWARAWMANLVALVFTAVYWLLQSDTMFPVAAAVYAGGKTGFALMLAQGAWIMTRNGRLFTTKQLAIGIAVYSLLAALLLRDITVLGIVQHSLMGAILIAMSIFLAKSRADSVTWLAGAAAARGLLAVAEAGAYFIQWRSPVDGPLAPLVQPAGTFLSASSSFDMGAEWLMVLGSVLAVSERTRHALEASHHRLVLVQDDLRRLADRDPLTGAINRRALRDIFKELEGRSAMLLFFDLDGFKTINDEHGHAAGDHCLQLFAAALKDSFRPSDQVVRYGGDEFLVIAQGIDRAAADARVGDVSTRLSMHRGKLACRFSVGMSELLPGGQPEEALQLADENMYKAKHKVRP
jgi:diguanylate cyclase (GGDEF)-like protein